MVTHLLLDRHQPQRPAAAGVRGRGAALPDALRRSGRARTGASARPGSCSAIVFDGHPHLVKLVLPEQFEGHPLRKDFALMSREAKPWPGDVEGEEVEDDARRPRAWPSTSAAAQTSSRLSHNFWLVLVVKVIL